MALQYSPRIVTDALVMCLDPSQNKSYPTIDLPIKDGLVMWMDAADDSTFSYSSGTTVSQWRDKSGYNYHMVPKSSGPTRNAFLNSRKVLAFTASQTIGNDTINLSSTTSTVFVVSRYTTGTNQRVLTCNLDSGGGNWLLGHWGGYVNQYYAEGWVSYQGYGNDTVWRVYMGDYSGPPAGVNTDLANIYSNGTAIVTNSTAASGGLRKLGVNYYSNETSTCEVAEIVVFNRVLSTRERNLIHTYLGLKWGISNTDRSIIDLSGNDDNGLLGNGTVANMPSFDYYNKGTLKFDGSTDYINCGNTNALNFGSGDFSVEIWFTRDSNATTNLRLLSKGTESDVSGSAGFAFFGADSVINFAVNPSGTRTIITAASYSVGEWVHVVGVVQRGSTMRTYKNAVLVQSTTAPSGSVSSASNNLNIGRSSESSSLYWPGNIAIVRIYNKALSITEISQNYEAQKSRFANTIVQQGLVLNLDAANPYSYAGAGDIWYDVSGNNNHATLYNSPTWNSNGYFSLNGTNNYIKTTSTLNLSTYNAVTVLVIFKARSYPASGNTKFICELSTDFNSFQYGFVWTYNDTSVSQNYEVFTSVKGNVGYNIGVWNKNNYSDLNWEVGAAVFDKSQSSAETSLYNQGVLANVISNPIAGYTSNNTNNFGDDYLFIGSRAGTSYFTDLDIASILVYNRALSAAEILQNYSAMKGRFGL